MTNNSLLRKLLLLCLILDMALSCQPDRDIEGGNDAPVKSTATLEPTLSVVTPSVTVVPLPSPEPLPACLREVRPSPSSIISSEQYKTVVSSGKIFEGPPPPAVVETGLRSSICFDLDVETLVEPGDLLFWDSDVLARIELRIDDRILVDRSKTEYLAVLEPPPRCKCFYSCDGFWDKWNSVKYSYNPPENVGCWFWPGYWYCYSTELGIGEHTATFSFRQTSGNIVSYTWNFIITE